MYLRKIKIENTWKNGYLRPEKLLGKDTLSALQNSHVLIVGVGGVGAYAAEMICRAGVQEITIIDGE